MITIKQTSMQPKKSQRYNNNSKCSFFEKTNTVNTTMVRLTNPKERKPKSEILEIEKKSKLRMLQR